MARNTRTQSGAIAKKKRHEEEAEESDPTITATADLPRFLKKTCVPPHRSLYGRPPHAPAARARRA